MPFFTSNSRNTVQADKVISYEYPGGIKLNPQGEVHRKLADKIFEWAMASRNSVVEKFDGWQTINRSLTGFVDPAITKKAKDAGDKTLPIVVPMSYATLEVFLTYTMNSLLRAPIFRYEGFGPEDVTGGALLEKVIESHCRRNRVALALNTMYRDAFVYGIGVATPVWRQKFGFKSEPTNEHFFSEFSQKFVDVKGAPKRVRSLMFEGNALENIDPFFYLPDPTVAAHDIQAAQYNGWIERTNIFDLLTEENESDSMFNVRYLKGHNATSVLRGVSEANRSTDRSIAENENIVDIIWIYGKIIPKDWELSDIEYPEKWLFGLAGDSIIIHAQPIDLDHDMIPMTATAPSGDGYSSKATSIMEIFEPMQTLIDWLFNSHISNVRKSINDMLIVDPSLINMKDLRDPQPGMLVRMRAQAWGKNSMEQAVKQLKVQDITQGHITDVTGIIDINQKVSGAVDFLFGDVAGGERRSATESRNTKTAALSRLEKMSKMISMQSMQDLSYMFAKHAQQFMSKELYVRTIGRWEETLNSIAGAKNGRVLATLEDINIDFDIIESDGSTPGNEPADLWINLFQMLTKADPEVRGAFDMVRIFKHVAIQLGAKNVEEFIKTDVQVLPDGEVAESVRKGDIVAVEDL